MHSLVWLVVLSISLLVQAERHATFVSQESHEEILGYWTAERMASAIPVELPLLDEPAVEPKPSIPSPQDPQGTPISTKAYIPDHLKSLHMPDHLDSARDVSLAFPFTSGYAPSYSVFPWTAIGRLYYTLNGENYAGSASVASPYAIYTAGSQLYSGGQWSSKILFIPAFHNGNASYGVYTGNQSVISSLYQTTYGKQYDYGMVVLNKANYYGSLLGVGQVVGYFGVAWDVAPPYTNLLWRITGYPFQTPFTGMVNYYTDSSYGTSDTNYYPAPFGVGNDATGGIGGASWVLSWGDQYLINSVVAYRYTNSPNVVYGPYFGADSYAVYKAATSIIPS